MKDIFKRSQRRLFLLWKRLRFLVDKSPLKIFCSSRILCQSVLAVACACRCGYITLRNKNLLEMGSEIFDLNHLRHVYRGESFRERSVFSTSLSSFQKPIFPEGGDVGRLIVAAIDSVTPSGQRLFVVLVCNWSVCGVVLVLMLIYYSLIPFLCLFYVSIVCVFLVLLAAI